MQIDNLDSVYKKLISIILLTSVFSGVNAQNHDPRPIVIQGAMNCETDKLVARLMLLLQRCLL